MKRSVRKGWLYAIAALVILLLVLSPASAGSKTTGSLTGITPTHLSIEPMQEVHATEQLSEASGMAAATAAPDLLWRFGIFWDGSFHGRAAIPANDGGYLVVGESRLGGSEESAQGAVVAITEPVDGQTGFKWAWLYGPDTSFDTFSGVAPDDNGYVFVGASRSFSPPQADAWLLHTDNDGWGDYSTYWQRYYPQYYATPPYNGDDQFSSVVHTSADTFVSAGSTRSYRSDGGSDAFLIDMDSTGTATGMLNHDGSGQKSIERIRQTSDGGYILTGTSDNRLYLLRLNADHSVRWEHSYGSNPDTSAHDVRQTSDSGFIAAGTTQDSSGHRSLYLLRTDADGTVRWQATPGSARPSNEGAGVVQTDDGGFVAAGTSAGVYVAKVDDAGRTVWEQVYIEQYPDSTVASIERTDDGGFLIGGTRIMPEEPAPGFHLVKLGPEKTVPHPIPLPGFSVLPTDPDGDGLYEDLNGNGAADFNDVVLFFTYLEWIGENEPISLFDFNVNGQIDFADITLLFEEL